MGWTADINCADWEHSADRMRLSNAGRQSREYPGLLVVAARLGLNSLPSPAKPRDSDRSHG